MTSDTGCVYCGDGSTTQHALRRADQAVRHCSACGNFHVQSLRTGQRYPLANPADPDSLPQINRR